MMGWPLRVVQVLAEDAIGGTEAAVSRIAEILPPQEVETTVVTFSGPGPVADRRRATGSPTVSLGSAHPLVLRRALERLRPDVVHAYGFRASMLTRVVTASVPGVKAVVGVRGLLNLDCHDPRSSRARTSLRAEAATQRLVAGYEANSQGAIDLLLRAGVRPDKVVLNHNGVDLATWSLVRRESADSPRLVCVARLTPLKDHDLLLRALAVLHERGIGPPLALVGDGMLREELEALVARLDLCGQVRFCGALDQAGVRRELAAADVFCLASLSEGSPGAVLEAMATGLPVVGTAVNGISDVVRDGVTGALVRDRTPTAFAAVLEAILTAVPERRAAMGAAARRHVEHSFSEAAMVQRRLDLYRRVVGVR